MRRNGSLDGQIRGLTFSRIRYALFGDFALQVKALDACGTCPPVLRAGSPESKALAVCIDGVNGFGAVSMGRSQ